MTNVVSTTASIARWGINMCQYTVPRVTKCYSSEDSCMMSHTLVFILTHNEEEPDNSHIKQFDAKEMKKMRDWKLPKEIKAKKERFCKVMILSIFCLLNEIEVGRTDNVSR